MRLRRLRMVNYRRHRDTEIEFPDGVTAIVGRNGSGKTTVLEAIAFALYSTQATRTNKDLLRHDRAPKGDALRVELDLEVAGQAMSIVRELRGANQTGTATLQVDGQTIVPAQAGSMDAVTQEITSRIGLDRETFFSTVFTPQKDLARLADRARNERKKLILGMLGIDAIDAAIQEGRTRRRAAEERLNTLQGIVPDLEALEARSKELQAAVKDSDAKVAAQQETWGKAQAELKAAEATHAASLEQDAQRRDLSAKQAAAKKEVEHADQRLADLEEQRRRAQEAEAQAKAVATDAAKADDLRHQVEQAINADHARTRRQELLEEQADMQKRLEAVKVPDIDAKLVEQAEQAGQQAAADLDAARQALAVAAAEQERLQQRLDEVDDLGDACPVCERPLDGHGDVLKQHLDDARSAAEEAQKAAQAKVADAEAKKQKADAAVVRVAQQQRRHDDAMAERKGIEEALQRCARRLAEEPDPGPAIDMKELRAQLAKALEAERAYARAQAQAEALPRLAGLLEQAQRALGDQRKTVERLSKELAALPDTSSAVLAAEQEVAAARLRERQAERDLGDAHLAQQGATQQLEHATKELEAAKGQANKLAQARIDHQHWQFLAGDRGTGLMERFRSHLVSRIGPAIQAEASRLISDFTGGRYTEVLLDESYDIYVVDDGVAYGLDRFSGGESDLVHLALRLAISRLLLERAGGAEIRFLALDEVFGSLDGERRGLVLQALGSLGTMYSQVLVVTHHEGLQDGLDHVLDIVDDDGEAVARMHNG